MTLDVSTVTRAVTALVDGRESIDVVARLTFEYQLQHNEAYARVCARRGVGTVRTWRDVPHVHVDTFRTQVFCTVPPSAAAAQYRTSGTTGNQSGVHYVPDTRLYQESSMRYLEQALLPAGCPRQLVSLIGPVNELPHSSLAQMISWAIERFGSPQSGYVEDARELSQFDEPILLLGTAFGLAECFKHAPDVRLPRGSTIMETGGFKGRYKELSRVDLHKMYHRAGVPSSHVVGEYGMTELSSQWYDGQFGHADADVEQRVYVPAPWARTRIVDAATMADVADGEVGLLCHFDPINIGSVQMILTSDLGRRVILGDGRDGFVYAGRASGAVIRGCSQMDE